jgi:pimeloyl-ACP methyl ester carboxylesterase
MRRRNLRVLCGHGGFSRLSYTEWGEADNPRVLICVHGLTRNGRDFDFLARELSSDYRVLCPDLPGRGDSDWLMVKADYCLPTYIQAMAALIARSGADKVDWLGTSLGGLIGMTIAATPGNPISRLVLNDIGPVMPEAALRRIASFVGTDPTFETLEQGEAYLHEALAAFGVTEAAHWAHIVETSIRPAADGNGFKLHYDPGIAQVFSDPTALKDVDIWPVWGMVTVPTLLLRGADSDLLSVETAAQMTLCGPKADFIEFPNCGHAPALFDHTQISVVKDWLVG